MPREKEPQRNLFEYQEEVDIGPEGIDDNKHLNNAHYLVYYQQQRARYMEALGMPINELQQKYNAKLFIYEFGGHYTGEVFLNDRITILTAAEVEKGHLRFYQRMVRGEMEVNDFQCTVHIVEVVKEEKKLRRIPKEVRERINEVNTPNKKQEYAF